MSPGDEHDAGRMADGDSIDFKKEVVMEKYTPVHKATCRTGRCMYELPIL